MFSQHRLECQWLEAMAYRRLVAPSILPRMGWLDSPDQDWCTNPPVRAAWVGTGVKRAIGFNPSQVQGVSERRTLGRACLEIRLHLFVGFCNHHENGPRKRCWRRPTGCLCVASAGCRQCVRQPPPDPQDRQVPLQDPVPMGERILYAENPGIRLQQASHALESSNAHRATERRGMSSGG